MKSLLSHIAGNFISQYENVANSSLCYLLNQYTAPQSALKKLLSFDTHPTRYATELSTKSNGRPDVTGLDPDGNKSVIIEGKFWANLTENQPGNYLKELAEGGKLLFLAPDRRLASLQHEIKKRLGEENASIVVCSWTAFLKLIESENSKEHDTDLASDLVQLKDLCATMDEEGMPPLSMTDLDPMNGRVCYQFADVIDDCNTQIQAWNESDFTGAKSVGSKTGWGFYFRAFGFGCFLQFSSYDWFMKGSHTPIWLLVYTEDWKLDEQIYCDLNNYDADNSYHETTKALYAIMLEPGMDRHQVVEHIERKIREVLSMLEQKAKSRLENDVSEKNNAP